MNILGIDPGKSGALCLLSPHGEILSLEDMPELGKKIDAKKLFSIINSYKNLDEPLFCYLEQQHMMPKQGGQFTIGVNYGFLIMALNALNIPYEEISPRKWQKTVGIKKADKDESVRLAEQFFVGWEFRKESKRAKKGYVIFDGRAEAALIALHGYKNRFN